MARLAGTVLKRSRPARKSAGVPADVGTRQLVLEAAGQVFAEKGFDRATGKEICERAGVNSAAVNYHFGGTEPLYAAVVREAQSRLVSVEALTAAVGDQSDPESKFRAIVQTIVRTATGPLSTSWAFRIIGREFLHRSAASDARREKEGLPKMALVRDVVGQVMGLPPDHPAVAHGCLMVVGPLVLLLVGDRKMLAKLLPALNLSSGDLDSLVEAMMIHGLAGLGSIARTAKGAAHRPAR